jgi:lysozyme
MEYILLTIGFAIGFILLIGAMNSNWFVKWDNKPSAGKILYVTEGMRIVALVRKIISERDALIIDISKWQGVINFYIMRIMGALGVIMKCGQGNGLDPRFRENWMKAKEAGLKLGSYWYYDSRISPHQQAKNWFEWLNGDYGELPHFADYEENYGGDYAGIEHFKAFLSKFQELTGLPDYMIGVYTGYFYWLENGSRDNYFRRFWLWIAWYSQADDVVIPLPWTQEDVLLWQYTDQGDGVRFGAESKELDMNLFVKGLEVFKRMFGAVVEVPEPEPEFVNRLVWSTRYAMSLRNAPSINGVRLESKPIGTRFLIDRISPPSSGGLAADRWGHVVSIAGIPKDGWVALVHDGLIYCDQFEDLPTGANPKVDVRYTSPDGRVWEVIGVELLPK